MEKTSHDVSCPSVGIKGRSILKHWINPDQRTTWPSIGFSWSKWWWYCPHPQQLKPESLHYGGAKSWKNSRNKITVSGKTDIPLFPWPFQIQWILKPIEAAHPKAVKSKWAMTSTLQGINISHLGKRKIIFKMPFWGDMLVPWRVIMPHSFSCFLVATYCFSHTSPKNNIWPSQLLNFHTFLLRRYLCPSSHGHLLGESAKKTYLLLSSEHLF